MQLPGHRQTLGTPATGAALVEFALILPLLFLLMVGLFDLGFAGYGWLQVQAAAEAGAQYAIRNTWSSAAIASEVAGATGARAISATPAPAQICACADGGIFTQTDCTATCASGNTPGRYASVSAQMEYQTILPYPGIPSPLLLSGHAYRRLR